MPSLSFAACRLTIALKGPGAAPYEGSEPADWDLVEAWVRTVSRMEDAGAASDVPAPPALGAFAHGPLPAIFHAGAAPAGADGRAGSAAVVPVATGPLSSVIGSGALASHGGALGAAGTSAATAEANAPSWSGSPDSLVPPDPAFAVPGKLFTWGEYSSRAELVLPLAPPSAAAAGAGAGGLRGKFAALEGFDSSSCGEVVTDYGTCRSLDVCVATTSMGRVLVWGGENNPSSRIKASAMGLNDSDDAVPPLHAMLLRTLVGKHIASVACGRACVFLLESGTGTLFSYGQGASGLLGHGDEQDRKTPRALRALTGVSIASVVVGDTQVLAAVTADAVRGGAHSLYAWGRNSNNSCGLESAAAIPLPTPVPGFFTRTAPAAPGAPQNAVLVRVSAAGDSSAAVSECGLLWTWGTRYFGPTLGSGRGSERPILAVPQLDPLLPPAHLAGDAAEMELLRVPGLDTYQHDGAADDAPAADGAQPGEEDNRQQRRPGFVLQEVAGATLPRAGGMTSVFYELDRMLQAQRRTVAPDLSVRFISVAVTRSGIAAVSADGRLWAMGRSDMGTTGHDVVGGLPGIALVRVPSLGPVAPQLRACPTLESALIDSDVRVVDVWPESDEECGLFVLTARRPTAAAAVVTPPAAATAAAAGGAGASSSLSPAAPVPAAPLPYEFTLMMVNAQRARTALDAGCFETLARAPTSLVEGDRRPPNMMKPTPLPAFSRMPVGICKVASSNAVGHHSALAITGLSPRMHAAVQEMFALPAASPAAAPHAAAPGAATPPAGSSTSSGLAGVSASAAPMASLHVASRVLFPGQPLRLSWRVPHGGTRDCIVMRPVWPHTATPRNGSRELNSATFVPPSGPEGHAVLRGPTSPGVFVISYLVGISDGASTQSTLQDWAARVDVYVRVAARLPLARGLGAAAIATGSAGSGAALVPHKSATAAAATAADAYADATSKTSTSRSLTAASHTTSRDDSGRWSWAVQVQPLQRATAKSDVMVRLTTHVVVAAAEVETWRRGVSAGDSGIGASAGGLVPALPLTKDDMIVCIPLDAQAGTAGTTASGAAAAGESRLLATPLLNGPRNGVASGEWLQGHGFLVPAPEYRNDRVQVSGIKLAGVAGGSNSSDGQLIALPPLSHAALLRRAQAVGDGSLVVVPASSALLLSHKFTGAPGRYVMVYLTPSASAASRSSVATPGSLVPVSYAPFEYLPAVALPREVAPAPHIAALLAAAGPGSVTALTDLPPSVVARVAIELRSRGAYASTRAGEAAAVTARLTVPGCQLEEDNLLAWVSDSAYTVAKSVSREAAGSAIDTILGVLPAREASSRRSARTLLVKHSSGRGARALRTSDLVGAITVREAVRRAAGTYTPPAAASDAGAAAAGAAGARDEDPESRAAPGGDSATAPLTAAELSSAACSDGRRINLQVPAPLTAGRYRLVITTPLLDAAAVHASGLAVAAAEMVGLEPPALSSSGGSAGATGGAGAAAAGGDPTAATAAGSAAATGEAAPAAAPEAEAEAVVLLLARSDRWEITAPPPPPRTAAAAAPSPAAAPVAGGSGGTVIMGSGVVIGGGVVISGSGAAAPAAAAASGDAASMSPAEFVFASDPVIDAVEIYGDTGAPTPAAMAVSGDAHARLLAKVRAAYQCIYAQSGVPAAMIDGLMATVMGQISASPVLSLSCILDSLKAQVHKP